MHTQAHLFIYAFLFYSLNKSTPVLCSIFSDKKCNSFHDIRLFKIVLSWEDNALTLKKVRKKIGSRKGIEKGKDKRERRNGKWGEGGRGSEDK